MVNIENNILKSSKAEQLFRLVFLLFHTTSRIKSRILSDFVSHIFPHRTYTA